MAQTVNRRPLTAEAPFRSRVIPCVNCGGQSVTVTVFLEYFGFSLSVSFHRCSITRKNEKTDHLLCVRSICCGTLPHTKRNINILRRKNAGHLASQEKVRTVTLVL